MELIENKWGMGEMIRSWDIEDNESQENKIFK